MAPHSAKDALEDYLSSLFAEAPAAPSSNPAAPAAAQPRRLEPEPAPVRQNLARASELSAPSLVDDQSTLEEHKRQKLQAMLSQQALSRPAPAAPGADVAPAPASEALAPLPPESEGLLRVERLLEWAENGRPLWAQSRFEALLFTVSGLSLAVPLVALGQIVPLEHDKLCKVVGQSDWFMGLLPTKQGDIRAVNTALLVMPERYDERFVGSAKYAVSIDGMQWALVVDEVTQPISLSPDDVKWRSERGKRPWLAGTVKSHMCALIDIPQVARLLEAADRNSTRIRREGAE